MAEPQLYPLSSTGPPARSPGRCAPGPPAQP